MQHCVYSMVACYFSMYGINIMDYGCITTFLLIVRIMHPGFRTFSSLKKLCMLVFCLSHSKTLGIAPFSVARVSLLLRCET